MNTTNPTTPELPPNYEAVSRAELLKLAESPKGLLAKCTCDTCAPARWEDYLPWPPEESQGTFNLAFALPIGTLAQLQPASAEEWLPIEQAPRDGTPLMLKWLPNEVNAPHLAKEAIGYWKKYQWQDGSGKPTSEPFYMWHSDEFSSPMSYAPTHFRPLPPRPSHSGGEAVPATGGTKIRVVHGPVQTLENFAGLPPGSFAEFVKANPDPDALVTKAWMETQRPMTAEEKADLAEFTAKELAPEPAATQAGEPVAKLLRMSESWSLFAVVQELVSGAHILLDQKNWDGHGHEGLRVAQQAAEDWMEKYPEDAAKALNHSPSPNAPGTGSGETPICDEACGYVDEDNSFRKDSDNRPYVEVEVARTLERSLADARRERDALKAEIGSHAPEGRNITNWQHFQETEALRAELARLTEELATVKQQNEELRKKLSNDQWDTVP